MIERQGQIFVFAACLILLANGILPEANLPLLLLSIVLLGVPHGALDTVYAQRQYQVQGVWQWALFGIAYLAPVLVVIVFWRMEPTWFLIGFLVISGVHFSGDPQAGVPLMARLLYGGAVVVLPAWQHAGELTRLFSNLIPAEDAAWITAGLSAAATPWAVAIGVAALWVARRHGWKAAELVAVGLLSAGASPLVSFTIFFCAMHSARHILRSFEYAGAREIRPLLVAASLPMGATLAALGAGFFLMGDTPLDAKLIPLIFVALAALTVPHMALVERVRFAGWHRETRGH
jgi:Brp/Blh family beta-carotene 15,15'-monooxygenase